MYSKPEIFNLALGMLDLTKEITDAENDPSKEAKTLRLRWNLAIAKVIEDLDLNAMAVKEELELIQEKPNKLWDFAYKYPNNCAFLRRISNTSRIDTVDTKIPLETGFLNGFKVIFTDEEQAVGEYLPKNVSLATFSPSACMALACMLAYLSTNLIVGKGGDRRKQEIMNDYRIYKAEAQEHDASENSRFFNPYEESDFVRTRMG